LFEGKRKELGIMRLRNWIEKQNRNRILLLSAPLVVVAGAAALGAFYNRGLERDACGTAREFADSAASEQKRLASVDSVVALFDLEDPAVVLKADTEFTHGEPNRLERRVMGLRLQGVTAPQIYRWLTSDLRLTPIAQNEHARSSDFAAQTEKLRAHEADTAYVKALIKNIGIAHNPWNDLSELRPLEARWTARCAAHRRQIWMLAAVFALAALVLCLCWLWWLRGTADSGPRA
jgi:hypothetical protein